MNANYERASWYSIDDFLHARQVLQTHVSKDMYPVHDFTANQQMWQSTVALTARTNTRDRSCVLGTQNTKMKSKEREEHYKLRERNGDLSLTKLSLTRLTGEKDELLHPLAPMELSWFWPFHVVLRLVHSGVYPPPPLWCRRKVYIDYMR